MCPFGCWVWPRIPITSATSAGKPSPVTRRRARKSRWSALRHAANVPPTSGRPSAPWAFVISFCWTTLAAAVLHEVFTDLMASVRPHVVVADGQQQAVRDAAATAFSQSRSADPGSAALPAKLYYRAFGATPAVELTTAVAVPRPPSPELFVRVFPSPWVTGVLERDLFAGIPAERQPATVRERLAS